MRVNRLMLDYASPGQPVHRHHRNEGSLDGLLCFVKLVCCFAVASMIGSLVAVVVAIAIEYVMR